MILGATVLWLLGLDGEDRLPSTRHRPSSTRPPGRFDIWVEWYAPCSAWLGLELTTDCADPTEVLSLFSSSVNMPFHGVDFGEGGSPPFDPYTEAEPITRGPTC